MRKHPEWQPLQDTGINRRGTAAGLHNFPVEVQEAAREYLGDSEFRKSPLEEWTSILEGGYE